MEERISQILKTYDLRKTKARALILEVLLKTHRMMSAQQIFEMIEQSKDAEDIWLSTVYRNIEQFQEKGLVEVISQPDKDTQMYRLNLGKHNHYAVCEVCYQQIPLDICPLDAIDKNLEEQGFKPTDHVLEVFGVCKNCQ